MLRQRREPRVSDVEAEILAKVGNLKREGMSWYNRGREARDPKGLDIGK